MSPVKGGELCVDDVRREARQNVPAIPMNHKIISIIPILVLVLPSLSLVSS